MRQERNEPFKSDERRTAGGEGSDGNPCRVAGEGFGHQFQANDGQHYSGRQVQGLAEGLIGDVEEFGGQASEQISGSGQSSEGEHQQKFLHREPF
ncbi:hypothetical protein [Glutamicibacter ardleyensis]|uniref:Uncharacterized protein n=1 Tax=Glutamicibacter ardleyensis TaxID=225894 RepID=A0ABQ2DLC8_9MICC|nr:hypothetical protein [Glutamicibacter ardleyensis]GGJ60111.1 hypothetical protein GCM10007173_18630 [Glutamicibacter ardleyensis]